MTKKSAFRGAEDILPPGVGKKPQTFTQHGRSRVDNYAWIRDDDWQEVLKEPARLRDDVRRMLEAENTYYENVTADLDSLRNTLFEEMRARIKEDDSSVPQADGAWKYGVKFCDGGQYPIFFRMRRDGGAEQMLLDGDAESGESEFFSIGQVAHSPDHNLIAYSVDRVGSENYTISVRKIASEEEFKDKIEQADGDSIIWSADSSGFFYVERDENQRPVWVKYHTLGADPVDDPVIYKERDGAYFLYLSKSQSGEFVFINSGSQITTEVRFVRARSPLAPLELIAERVNGVEYYVEHHGDSFLIKTNADGAVDFKVVKAPISAPGKENWEDWIAHNPGTYIADIIPFAKFFVRYERFDALPRIVISDYDGDAHEVSFDQAAYALGVDEGFEFDTEMLRFTYESPSTPKQTYDYNMATRQRTLLKSQEVPSGHDPSQYVVERIDAPAPDGAKIPVVVMRLKSTPMDGAAPLLLYGYGSYGITISNGFSTNVLPLVDRGVAYAVAHVRGGAAKGRQWYLDGKLGDKMNTFTDFTAAADALIQKNYTSAKKIVSYGGSAGGLLVGATVNLRPELFAGVLAAVPFVDVITTISDAGLPLTPPEWEEWGNPLEGADQYDWIAAYSPYDNVKNVEYPPIMATGGLTDYRVTYWEPAKWIAKLREVGKGGPFVLRMNMGAGHGGSAARFERLEERAHLYAFALKAVGYENVEPIKHH
ncbi:S9 family peptidase [Hyphococcus flavus]|uniref:S9 family peptidase n=1 Tax=Hyphococcus flavus TaxID=1866326 RepID=A0AAE9ZE72_9PROT|nr:S9 family peptidase [Hyphococcus flavus]WDI31402.1 S9 family peptidase [Hyphococcus flavus]